MTSPADAAGPDGLVRVVALWRATAGDEAAIRAILRELAAVTGREPGCVRFDVLESASQPGSFVLIEQYAGSAAHAGHLSSPHFQDLVLTRAVPRLAYRDVQVYTVLTLEGSSNS